MRFLRRSLVGLFLMALTIGVLALAGDLTWSALQARWAEGPPSRRVQERVFAVDVVTVEAQRIAPVLQVYGEVRSARTLQIRAAAAGRVVFLSNAFEEGGTVTAGDLLMQIDPSDAQSALRVAQSDLEEAQAEVADSAKAVTLAQDDLDTARAQAQLRALSLGRQKDARKRGVGTDTLVEEAELAEVASRQAVVSRRQGLAAAQSRAAQAKIALDRQRIVVAEAQRALADTEIRADFSGTLAGVKIVSGGLVTTNEALGELVDPDRLEVAFRLSAGEYARLLDRQGKLIPAQVAVSLDVEGSNLATTGRIVREGATVGEGQTGRLLFAALETPRGLKPGDFVSVRIDEPALDDVALLPATALAADGTVLAVGEGERLERLPADLLRRQGDAVIVRAEGLAGREVVREQTPLLGAGIRVRPLTGSGLAQKATGSEMVELSAERRARLVAFVRGNAGMPAEAKKRVLAQLAEPMVPAQVVERIESRMGG